MPSYETSFQVRFGDIDHAGIVYYPRVYHYFHMAFEEFFEDLAGIPYHRILDERKIGFPTVKADAEFHASLSYGDLARVEMETVHVGRTSLSIRYRIRANDSADVAMEAVVTTVCVGMDDFRPRPIPDDLRKIFEAHRG